MIKLIKVLFPVNLTPLTKADELTDKYSTPLWYLVPHLALGWAIGMVLYGIHLVVMYSPQVHELFSVEYFPMVAGLIWPAALVAYFYWRSELYPIAWLDAAFAKQAVVVVATALTLINMLMALIIAIAMPGFC